MKSLLIILLFMYIYIPPISNINTLHICSIIALINLLLFNSKMILNILKKSKLINIMLLFLLMVMYLLAILTITSGEYIHIYNYILLLVEVPIICTFFIIQFNKNKYTIDNILEVFFITATIQSIIAFLAWSIPSVQENIVSLFIKNGLSDIIKVFSDTRYYGFSYYLTSTAPMVQSFIALLALNSGIHINKKYYKYIPLILFSAVINSRTSLVIFFVGVIITILISISKLNLSKIAISSISVLISIFIFKFIMNITYKYSPTTYKWIEIGINEVITFLNGKNTGYFNTLINDFIIFPKGISLFIGEGISLFGIKSDVGFINSIWIGGLCLVIPTYLGIVLFYSRLIFIKGEFYTSIGIITIVTFILGNIKGDMIYSNEFMNFTLLICSIIYFKSREIGIIRFKI